MTTTAENAIARDQTTGLPGIHLMAKPTGPACNLRCQYCFYLEKGVFFAEQGVGRMSDEVLEAYIRACVSANPPSPQGIPFAWQGGEPTLLGLEFFRKALILEKRYTQGRPFTNALQTNGTLLSDEWCEFLARSKFLVGLSLDGPASIHDFYRKDARGEPTFKSVLRALKLLQKHGVEYNVLACVARETAKHALEVYRFFKDQGVQFVQFSPVVERLPDTRAKGLGLRLGLPPSDTDQELTEVTPWTVDPETLGDFYNAIFDEWVRHDVGKMYVMNFEWTVYAWLGGLGPVCYLNNHCGNCVIVEHNGDVYACDHYVYPEFRLGNILSDTLPSLIGSARQKAWGERKATAISNRCKVCDVGSICRGGCPKHRFMKPSVNEPGQNYLCAGYRKFYTHTRKYMQALAKLVELDLPCEHVMKAIDQPVLIPARAGRNEQSVLLWIK